MLFMFNNCIKLKYLDLSNFSPINVTTMESMFNKMSSLIYLNLYSFDINNQTNMTSAFNALPSNLKICATKNNIKDYLSRLNINNICSDICFNKNIKLDIIEDECINSCKDKVYNHELNNICYNNSCPEGSYPIIKNISNKDNIFNEFEDGIIICLDRNPEGYYLNDYGFYEKCFDNCKFCYGLGDEKNNNCKKCIKNYLFIYDYIYKTNCY